MVWKEIASGFEKQGLMSCFISSQENERILVLRRPHLVLPYSLTRSFTHSFAEEKNISKALRMGSASLYFRAEMGTTVFGPYALRVQWETVTQSSR